MTPKGQWIMPGHARTSHEQARSARRKPPERMRSSGIAVRSTRGGVPNAGTGRYSLGK